MKRLSIVILVGPKRCQEPIGSVLTVNGESQNQPLQVIMDPRSSASPEILQQRLDLAQQIYAETLEARRVLAEIGSVQKKLADSQQKLGDQNSAVKTALANAQNGNREDSHEQGKLRKIKPRGCRMLTQAWHRRYALSRAETVPRLRKRLRFTESQANKSKRAWASGPRSSK